ncbi:uncharacterized protein CLUP02_02792 [Colletotrichum lupini]|uniref:Uncharacterized protein n=1 Tax=Colletotrichum lupini TaxID=145971 RepID=A0A9Q8SHE0_9PEZI|nr:uncharacterized protein CLUP02_02792 [Colletotrichum lupini]UQC77324.1 hypothetical protein CLUP02_02792 [Colletotrichum lupini]
MTSFPPAKFPNSPVPGFRRPRPSLCNPKPSSDRTVLVPILSRPESYQSFLSLLRYAIALFTAHKPHCISSLFELSDHPGHSSHTPTHGRDRYEYCTAAPEQSTITLVILNRQQGSVWTAAAASCRAIRKRQGLRRTTSSRISPTANPNRESQFLRQFLAHTWALRSDDLDCVTLLQDKTSETCIILHQHLRSVPLPSSLLCSLFILSFSTIGKILRVQPKPLSIHLGSARRPQRNELSLGLSISALHHIAASFTPKPPTNIPISDPTIFPSSLPGQPRDPIISLTRHHPHLQPSAPECYLSTPTNLHPQAPLIDDMAHSDCTADLASAPPFQLHDLLSPCTIRIHATCAGNVGKLTLS